MTHIETGTTLRPSAVNVASLEVLQSLSKSCNFLGSFYEGFKYFGSILGAPEFFETPAEPFFNLSTGSKGPEAHATSQKSSYCLQCCGGSLLWVSL